MSRLNAACAVTLAGLGCGLTAIAAATDGHLQAATSLIIAAMIFDHLDGTVARRLDQVSPIGAQLDSLADMVSFGVAPVFLIRALCDHALVDLGGLLYALAAAWRLARFHQEDLIETPLGLAFVGVPTPGAALWMLLAAVALPVHPVALTVLLLLAAAGMVSHLPYPKGGPMLVSSLAALGMTLGVVWLG